MTNQMLLLLVGGALTVALCLWTGKEVDEKGAVRGCGLPFILGLVILTGFCLVYLLSG